MKVQRKAVFWGLLFWILLALGGSVQADEGGYTITDYDVKAILHTDNTIDVTERIGVYFTEERHGLSEYSLGDDSSPGYFQKTGQE